MICGISPQRSRSFAMNSGFRRMALSGKCKAPRRFDTLHPGCLMISRQRLRQIYPFVLGRGLLSSYCSRNLSMTLSVSSRASLTGFKAVEDLISAGAEDTDFRSRFPRLLNRSDREFPDPQGPGCDTDIQGNFISTIAFEVSGILGLHLFRGTRPAIFTGSFSDSDTR